MYMTMMVFFDFTDHIFEIFSYTFSHTHTHTKQIAFSKSQDAYLYQEKGYLAS